MTKKRNDEAVEKLDVESLIVDLLCCGLGSCVILFFIFSIKIIGPTFSHTRAKTGASKKGQQAAQVSLIGDNGKGKKMGAVRVVHLYDLAPENLTAIMQYTSNPAEFWDLRDFRSYKKLEGSIVAQVQRRNNDVSFFLYADGMRTVHFRFPQSLKDILMNSRGEKNGKAGVVFIEGQSMKGDFKRGFYESGPYTLSDLKALDIKLDIGVTSNIDRLVTVSFPSK